MKPIHASILSRSRLSLLILLAAVACLMALRPAQFIQSVAAKLPQSAAQGSRAARLAAGDRYETEKIPALPKALNTPAVQTGLIIYAYNLDNDHLLKFDAGEPGTILSDIALTGLAAGEFLEAIDFRPSTGLLYGIADNNTLDRVVTINTTTGAVTSVGGTVADTTGVFYGMDFNPVADRIRQLDDSDNNRRFNPNDGMLAGIDTTLAYVAGDPGAGGSPMVVHTAYNNNFAGTAATTLYGIDSARDTLVRIGGVDGNPSPNTGQVTTIGPLGVDVTAFGGMDISLHRVCGVARGGRLASLHDQFEHGHGHHRRRGGRRRADD